MKIDKKLFSENIILFHQDIKDKDELFNVMNQKLVEKNVVNSGFLSHIKKREKTFPTGLKLQSGFGVAIPHTDPKYVNEDQIGFISLNNPINFRQMGSDTETVDAKMVFILCLKEAHKQLNMLQNLMALFGDDAMVKKIYECNSEKEFIKLID